jgi:hypothetical protein
LEKIQFSLGSTGITHTVIGDAQIVMCIKAAGFVYDQHLQDLNRGRKSLPCIWTAARFREASAYAAFSASALVHSGIASSLLFCYRR